jgi:hypothetical protein
MRRTVLLFLAALVLTAACGPGIRVSSSRTGKGQPPKAADCEIRFEDLPYQEAVTTYEEIGQIWLTGDGAVNELTESQKALLRPEACKLGGEVVTVGSAVGSGASSNAIFLVLGGRK